MYANAHARTVVVGVDFSAASMAAAYWTVEWLAKDAELVLAHALVVPEVRGVFAQKYPLPESLLANARAGAERRLSELSLSLGWPRTRIEIREGRPADAIADVARDCDAWLVVVGKHGESGPHRGYTGRTADALVRQCPSAVLLASGMSGRPPRKVLVAVTYSSVTPFIVSWTRRIYDLSGADIEIVHVIGSAVLSHVLTMSAIKGDDALTPEVIDREFSEDRNLWKKIFVDAGIPEKRITSRVIFGEVSDGILDEAASHSADMIVMGSHAGPVRRVLLGSAATAVLRKADVPVLVVVEPQVSEIEDAGDDEKHELVGAAAGSEEFK
jgi:nucleotide-binding universal stress UspA family protein